MSVRKQEVNSSGPNRASRRAARNGNVSRAALKRQRATPGSLHGLMVEAEKRIPNDPKGQLAYVGERCNGLRAAIGVDRNVGQKRQTDLIEVYSRCFDLLKAAGARCNTLSEFSIRHTIHVVGEMEKQDYSDSTVHQYICVMRRMNFFFGKPEAVPTRKELAPRLEAKGITAGTQSRNYVCDLALGWRDQGFDVDREIAAIAEYDELAGIWFGLMYHFGLRIAEAVSLQPVVSWNPEAGVLHVFRGTKGGKARDVHLFKEPQRRAQQIAAMEAAVAWAKRNNRKNELGVPGLDLEQTLERVRTICKRFSITKGEKGIVPHGLRHQFGCDLFQDRSGMPAPVLGKLPVSTYAERQDEVDDAMLYVSRELGHERKSISTAYAGSVGRLTKNVMRLRRTLAHLEGQAPVFALAQVDEAWLMGLHAQGIDPARAGALVVQVLVKPEHHDTYLKHSKDLTAALSGALNGIEVFALADPRRADTGVEILFQRELPTQGALIN